MKLIGKLLLVKHALSCNNQNGFTVKEMEEGRGRGILIGRTKKKGWISRLENGSEVRIGRVRIYFPPNEITPKNGRLNGHFINSCTTGS
jgi:hypothetical protein